VKQREAAVITRARSIPDLNPSSPVSSLQRSARHRLLAVLWLVPPLYICWLVCRYAVDVPFDDDLAIGDDIYHWISGTLRWADLIAQHNESRPLFPRILFSVLASHAGWDLRYQMACSILLVACTSLLSLAIALRSISNRPAALAIGLLMNLLWFSPAQWLNFLWGIQFITFVPALSLVVVILALGSNLPLPISVMVSAISAIVATYSNANGLLVWIVSLPLLVLTSSRFRFLGLVAWGVLGTITCTYYFHDYQSPDASTFLMALRQPTVAVGFVLAFLGNGVRRNANVDSACLAGLLVLLSWGSGVTYALLRCRSVNISNRLLPWITLGAYSIASACMAMLGRVIHFGLPGAVTERYPTFAIPIWLSIVPLWVVLFQQQHLPRPTRCRRTFMLFPWLASLIIIMLTVRAAYSVRNDIRYYNARRLAGRATAQFALVAPDKEAINKTLCPGSAAVIQTLQNMHKVHRLTFDFIGSDDINEFDATNQMVGVGEFSSITAYKGRLLLRGWAYLPAQRRMADAVLLTSRDPVGHERLFAIAFRDREERSEVKQWESPSFLSRSGWTRTVDAAELKPGGTVSAWAFDTYTCQAYRLAGTHIVPPAPDH
jgi:hypothetical protein